MTCSLCGGVGYFVVDRGPKSPPAVELCACQKRIDLVENMERGWRGLVKADKIPSSPLKALTKENVWATANFQTMRSHVRHVALHQSTSWRFRGCTDVDLMTSWLASTILRRGEIFDSDISSIASVTSQMHSLQDFVEPPELLIIQLGVKSARNSAMSEVFLEALRIRMSVDRPTWVFDQRESPFDISHLAYSQEAYDELSRFKRVDLTSPVKSATIVKSAPVSEPAPVVHRESVVHREPAAPREPARVNSAAASLIDRVGKETKKKRY